MKDHEQWGNKKLVDKIKMTILVRRRERVLSVKLQKETFTILLLCNECIVFVTKLWKEIVLRVYACLSMKHADRDAQKPIIAITFLERYKDKKVTGF